MYAIFEDGSRQYRVYEGDVVKVDFRDQDVGSTIEFNHVLLCAEGNDCHIGQPLVEGARILGEVIGHPSTKLQIQKFRRRKNYRRLTGHRQPYTAVSVRHILLKGQEPKAPEPKQEAAAPENPT